MVHVSKIFEFHWKKAISSGHLLFFLTILSIILISRSDPHGINPKQNEIEKKWIEQQQGQGQGGRGGVVGQEVGGKEKNGEEEEEEDYYMYYYEEDNPESSDLIDETKTTATATPIATTTSQDFKTPNKNPLDFIQFKPISDDLLIGEAKKYCNCTTREETAALHDHAIIMSEVRELENKEKQKKKERHDSYVERQKQKEEKLQQEKEAARKRDREKIESMLSAQSKSSKPGHRTLAKLTDFEQIPTTPIHSHTKFFDPLEDDEIPDYMEPPAKDSILNAYDLRKLEEKYALYLKKKQDDILIQGPIIGSDCEDLICMSCKITVEQYVKSQSFPLDEFCEKKIGTVYEPLTKDLCHLLLQDESVQAALQHLDPHESLNDQKRKICVPMGFCSNFDYRYDLDSIFSDDKSTKCLFCSSLVKDLQTRVSLLTKVDQDVSRELVKQSCSLMTLPPDLQTECISAIKGTNIAKLSWNMKLYGESILRKGVRSKQRYSLKVCEEIKYCEKLSDIQKKPIVADAPFW